MLITKAKLLEKLSDMFDAYRIIAEQYRMCCLETNYLKNLTLSDSFVRMLGFVTIDNNNYAIYLKDKKAFPDKTISMVFVIGNTRGILNNSVTVAEVDLKDSLLEIVNIDTLETHRRKGFASMCIKSIEKYALEHDIHKITGMLFQGSDIGKDNLLAFYRRNGFSFHTQRDGSLWFEKEI